VLDEKGDQEDLRGHADEQQRTDEASQNATLRQHRECGRRDEERKEKPGGRRQKQKNSRRGGEQPSESAAREKNQDDERNAERLVDEVPLELVIEDRCSRAICTHMRRE
jgi:hypothetical protein